MQARNAFVFSAPLAVTVTAESVKYYSAGAYSGIDAEYSPQQRNEIAQYGVADFLAKRSHPHANPTHGGQLLQLTAFPLPHVLRAAAIGHVDLLSLDIEGGERAVLQTLLEAGPHPTVLLVELKAQRAEIEALLHTSGYRHCRDVLAHAGGLLAPTRSTFSVLSLCSGCTVLCRDCVVPVRDVQ